jgi:hypothetical protein
MTGKLAWDARYFVMLGSVLRSGQPAMVQSRPRAVKLLEVIFMLQAAQRLREALFFYRHQFFTLALLLLPVLLPACLLLLYRFWAVFGGDLVKFGDDLLANVLIMLGWRFALAVTMIHSAAVLDGRMLPAGEVRRQALLAVPALVVLDMLVSLAVMGGLVMLIVPGLWLAGCLAPAQVLVAVEKQSILAAVQGSVERFRAVAWQQLLALLLLNMGLFTVLLMLMVFLSTITTTHWPLPARLLFWAVVCSGGVLAAQVIAVMQVRFYDLQRQPRAAT